LEWATDLWRDIEAGQRDSASTSFEKFALYTSSRRAGVPAILLSPSSRLIEMLRVRTLPACELILPTQSSLFTSKEAEAHFCMFGGRVYVRA